MDHYVLNDVPQSEWLYADRGMAKWLGWLLSDHTQYLTEQAKAAHPEPLLPPMEPAVIDSCLQQAWEKSQPVHLQLTPDFDSQQAPAITGMLIGFGSGQIQLVQRDSGVMVAIATEDIRHAAPIETRHWWAA